MLTEEEEAIVVAFRQMTLLPLGDGLYTLQSSLPHLTRSALHRCFQRPGVSHLPDVEGKPVKKKFKIDPIGYFHIDIAEVRTEKASSTYSWPSTAPASLPILPIQSCMSSPTGRSPLPFYKA